MVAVATECHVYPKMLSNIQEVKARGAEVIAVATEGDEQIAGVARPRAVGAARRRELCRRSWSPSRCSCSRTTCAVRGLRRRPAPQPRQERHRRVASGHGPGDAAPGALRRGVRLACVSALVAGSCRRRARGRVLLREHGPRDPGSRRRTERSSAWVHAPSSRSDGRGDVRGRRGVKRPSVEASSDERAWVAVRVGARRISDGLLRHRPTASVARRSPPCGAASSFGPVQPRPAIVGRVPMAVLHPRGPRTGRDRRRASASGHVPPRLHHLAT